MCCSIRFRCGRPGQHVAFIDLTQGGLPLFWKPMVLASMSRYGCPSAGPGVRLAVVVKAVDMKRPTYDVLGFGVVVAGSSPYRNCARAQRGVDLAVRRRAPGVVVDRAAFGQSGGTRRWKLVARANAPESWALRAFLAGTEVVGLLPWRSGGERAAISPVMKLKSPVMRCVLPYVPWCTGFSAESIMAGDCSPG